MSQRTTGLSLFAILAVCAALLAIMILRTPEDADKLPTVDARAAANGSDGTPLGEVDATLSGAQLQGSGGPAPVRTGASNAQDALAGDEAPNSVARVIILDEEGVEHDMMSGTLTVLRDTEESGMSRQMAFVDGRLVLEGLGQGQYRAVAGTVQSESEDARSLFFDELGAFQTPATDVILRGRVMPSSRLVVADALSGVELPSIHIAPSKGDFDSGLDFGPGPLADKDYLLINQTSPVLLPFAPGTHQYWVTAEGYDWKLVEVDHDTGGEQRVSLQPAGSLRVQVSGMSTDKDFFLRVYTRENMGLVMESQLGPSGFQGLNNVATGVYAIRVEGGGEAGRAAVFGQEVVTVMPLEIAQVAIDVKGNTSTSNGAIGGVLVLPADYKAEEMSVLVVPAASNRVRATDVQTIPGSQMTTKGKAHELHWATDHLSPGLYNVVVEPIMFSQTINVFAESVSALRLTPPSVLSVSIGVVEEGTQEPVLGASLEWMRPYADGEPGRWHKLTLGDDQVSAPLRLTPGKLTVRVADERLQASSRDFEVSVNEEKLMLEAVTKR